MNSQTGFYEITLDVTKGMDHINGDYDMEIHAADFRADQRQVWQLGSIRIWFREGSDEATNEGIREEYKSGAPIVYYFRPDTPEKGIVVSKSNLIDIIATTDQCWSNHLGFPAVYPSSILEQSKPIKT